MGSSSNQPLAQAGKRLLDVVLATLGLAVLGPVVVLLAVAVRALDGGPCWFRQTRVGQHGRLFTILKLRTMVEGAEAAFEVVRTTEAAEAVKPAADPRVTSLGRVLRRWSLDELPQLVNVVRGEMSLVGPRPCLPTEVVPGDDRYRRRFTVPPGMTGLWQVSGRADLPFWRGIELDLQYVDRWNLWLDVVLLVRTIPAVITGVGAR